MEWQEERAFPTTDCVCTARRGGNNEKKRLTHHDLVLPREVGGLAEQLCLGHSDGARGLSNQHCVVELGASRRRGAEVFAL